MILDKRRRALLFTSFFCLAAALGGGARAAQVYQGCAEPGATGKVWYVDSSTANRRPTVATAPRRIPGTASTP